MSGSSSGADAPQRIHPLPALLALAQGATIWWLSSQSSLGPSGKFGAFLGNSAHFVLFGVLAVLLAEACRRDGGWSRAALAVVLAFTVTYGALDEFHQSFTPGRTPDVADVCVDFLGAVGCLSFWWGVRGPGGFKTALVRGIAVGLATAAFNAWRTWGSQWFEQTSHR